MTNLDLSGNNIGNSGASSLSDATKFNTILTNLNMSYSNIDNSGVGYLSDTRELKHTTTTTATRTSPNKRLNEQNNSFARAL